MGDDFDGLLTGDGGYYDLYSGDFLSAPSVGIPPDMTQAPTLPGDVADAQQMEPWKPQAARDNSVPWWAGIAAYGITRAIDNQFPGSPQGTLGNVYPGSFSGYNGRTYTARPSAIGGGAASASLRFGMGGNPLLMVGLLVGAVLLLK